MVTFQRRRPAEQCKLRVQITGGVSFLMGDLATQVDSATRRERELDQSGNQVTVYLTDREWTRLPTLILESVREQYVHDLLQSTDKGSVEAEANAQTRLAGQAYAYSASGGPAQVGLELHLDGQQTNVPNKVLKAFQGVGIRPLEVEDISPEQKLLYPEGSDQNRFDIDSYKPMMEELRNQLQLEDTRLVCRTV